jgi:hypothetical protein
MGILFGDAFSRLAIGCYFVGQPISKLLVEYFE